MLFRAYPCRLAPAIGCARWTLAASQRENLPPANATRYTAPRPQPPCPSAMDQPDLDQLRRKLSELKSEHRDLDDVISHLVETRPFRSEEHTSELQSLMRISYADFCWKKKKNKE